ncbi:MAG: BREX-1 system adenine-specific DNA-methyltransferase PglX [Chloroflexi bacterium]|nr:BREX-1 system adenine-specific DNA-methyltransferase PglX [Chloroflexota bacterium]
MSLTEASGMQALREALRHDLNLFREADNFGSLLRPMLRATQLTLLHNKLTAVAQTGQLQMFDQARRKKAVQAIEQAIPWRGNTMQ